MKKIKPTYVACQLHIVEFNVEKGFAQASVQPANNFINMSNINTWTMTKEEAQPDFRNQKYGKFEDMNAGLEDWF